MASEADTRKAMSDFGIKGKHLQDMVQSFGRGFKKAEEPKKETPPAPSRAERRYNAPESKKRYMGAPSSKTPPVAGGGNGGT